MIVFLIRHGQTAWNTERRFLGRTDIPLDAIGIGQATALGAALGPFDHVWSSPSSRAMQTAERLTGPAGTGGATAHPGLQEMDMGALEGLDGPSFARDYPHLLDAWRSDPSTVDIPGGESLAQTQSRVHAAWDAILAEPGERIAIVTHQLALGALLCALTERPLHDFPLYSHLNTAYTVLRVEDGVVTIDAVNQAPHLA